VLASTRNMELVDERLRIRRPKRVSFRIEGREYLAIEQHAGAQSRGVAVAVDHK